MEFIIKHIGEIIGFLTFLGSFAGGLWFIFNYLSKNFKDPIKQVIDNQTAIFQKVDVFESKLDKVCKIVGYEFQKNGGGSSIDKIDRIERAVNDISDRQLIDFYLDHQPKYECDVNGYCIRVNYKWRELTGLSEEDALGNQWLKAVHPKDREELQKNWGLFITKSIPFEAEYRLIHPQTLNETYVIGKAIKKEDKNNIHIIIGTFDVVKTKKYEKSIGMASKT